MQVWYKTFANELTNVIGEESLMSFVQATNAYFFQGKNVSLKVQNCISVSDYYGKGKVIFNSLHEIKDYLLSEGIVENHKKTKELVWAVLSLTYKSNWEVVSQKMEELREMYKKESQSIVNKQ